MFRLVYERRPGIVALYLRLVVSLPVTPISDGGSPTLGGIQKVSFRVRFGLRQGLRFTTIIPMVLNVA